MNVLLFAHHAYSEFTNGATRSMRSALELLVQSGHRGRAITTARLESRKTADLRADLRAAGIAWQESVRHGLDCLSYRAGSVDVLAVQTRHNDPRQQDAAETDALAALTEEVCAAERPDVVFGFGGHNAVQHALRIGRKVGARTIFTMRGFGYNQREWYHFADRVFVASRYMAEHYRAICGVRAEVLPSPVLWDEVQAPDAARDFLTFINPAPHKGLAVFARLAAMLRDVRPEIPLLVVESRVDARSLMVWPELQLHTHPNLMVVTPVADMRGVYGLTRVLLVPSVMAEPSARVSIEAIVNGIPVIASDRGGLPDSVQEGGIVLGLPNWLTEKSPQLPSEAEIRPWFDAVLRLWDDPEHHAAMVRAAHDVAERCYAPEVIRRAYDSYFSDPGPYQPLFD